MGWPLKIRTQKNYILTFVLLLLSYLIMFYVIYELNEETKGVLHSAPVINILNTLIVISLLVALLTVIFAYFTFSREKKETEKANMDAILERKKLEENINKLQEINQELLKLKNLEKFAFSGRIARTIAHEVRNPLTNISLATEQLKEINEGNADADTMIQMIKKNATRINQLVSELLASTQFAKLNYELANITEILDDTLKLVMSRNDLKNTTRIEKKYSNKPLYVHVDKEKIKLAFVNIIVNAMETMGEDPGVLQISAWDENSKCIIQFADNSIGMEETIIQRIFEPYFTNKTKGAGLGMTHTQNIILNHEGNIEVDSKPGTGTTFTITLAQKTN